MLDVTVQPAPRHIVIVGPTSSGKSRLAMDVAARLGDAEIVSVDSMQVYRGMEIGTGAPSAADHRSVAHHLVGVIEPDQQCSVGWFRQRAEEAVAGIESRGHRAIFVGGTGLYHRAVVDNLQIPGDFPEVAAGLECEPDAAVLAERLAAVDPVAASRIEAGNRRRLIRALEVCIGSGQPFSSFGPGLTTYEASPHLMVGLSVDRAELGPRIQRRVTAMMQSGWIDEVQALLRRNAPLSRTAAQALGYRELIAHLGGHSTESEAVEKTVTRTRQFAVRQDRWFRRDPRIEWHHAETPSLADQIADTVSGR